MRFLNPDSLYLLLLLPVAILVFRWRNRVRLAKLGRLGDKPLLAELLPAAHPFDDYARLALWTAALLACVVALARPVWGAEVNLVDTQGVSVMLLLDVSRSMDARDILPSRLERAKFAVQDLLYALNGNELGMIWFAGTAFVQFPLTFDTTSASTFVGNASTDAITPQGTNIADALRFAIDGFHNGINSRPFIILMTDGENHEGDTEIMAQRAAEQGITIHVIGYGTPEGVLIPLVDDSGSEIGFVTDRAGNLVQSALDEPTLRRLAEVTGGTYQRATESGEEITALVRAINSADEVELGVRTETRSVERFTIFVAIALLTLALEMLYPFRRSRSL